jgi:para-aminobenzoate synthetase component I
MPSHSQLLHDLAAPFVLLDDARAGSSRMARLYRDPVGVIRADQLGDVHAALVQLEEARRDGLHAAGFLCYEAGYALEAGLDLPSRNALASTYASEPLLWFGLFPQVEEFPADQVATLLPALANLSLQQPVPAITRAAYDRAMAQVLALIEAGDIYQANLTFPCTVPVADDPCGVYAAVRPRAGAGHGALIHHEGGWLLSFSPELFFDLGTDGRIETRPMKGTAPRAADEVADKALAKDLSADAKQRAENLMIVDLMRNDLARVCRPGSVRVPALFKVETYPTVHQMISVIEGQVQQGLGPLDVLRALFPCGSITGAPKRRAMEVIAGVESSPRGAYTGAIGAIAPDGSASFNVAIRTLSVQHDSKIARLGLGSGVVADSIAAAEWQECLDKGRFLGGSLAGADGQ